MFQIRAFFKDGFERIKIAAWLSYDPVVDSEVITVLQPFLRQTDDTGDR